MHRTLAVVLALTLAPAARAAVFRDPASGFTMDLAEKGAAVCVIVPKELRTDLSPCEGLDLALMEGKAVGQRLLAAVRFQDWSYWVAVTSRPSLAPRPPSRADGLAYHAGAVEETKRRGEYTVGPAELLLINDLQVLRYQFSATDRSSPVSEMIFYGVFGKKDLVTINFMTDASHVQAVRDLAARTVASIRLPPARVPARWEDRTEDDPSSRAAQGVLRAVGELAKLAAICIGAVLLYRAWRRKRAPAATAPSSEGRRPPDAEPGP